MSEFITTGFSQNIAVLASYVQLNLYIWMLNMGAAGSEF